MEDLDENRRSFVEVRVRWVCWVRECEFERSGNSAAEMDRGSGGGLGRRGAEMSEEIWAVNAKTYRKKEVGGDVTDAMGVPFGREGRGKERTCGY